MPHCLGVVLIGLLLALNATPPLFAEEPKAERGGQSVRLLLPNQAGQGVQTIARILARRIEQKCNARVLTEGQAETTVELILRPGGPSERYRIEDRPEGGVRIVAADTRGLLYGTGKFLRTSRYDQGGFTPSRWRGESSPSCPLRGVYLATHFMNYYEAAPIGQVQEYIEDLGLWGYNTILIHYPTWQFDGFSDPASRAWLARFRTLLAAARNAGVQAGLIQVPNQGFKTAPKESRGKPVPGHRRGNHGVNLCVSRPEARAELQSLYDTLLAEFQGTGLDCFCFWPYDEGGCACDQCWPWGARGYVEIVRRLAPRVRSAFPGVKLIVSTWCFENEDDANPDGEWTGFSSALAKDQSWADYVMADGHDDYFPGYVLRVGVPGGLPLLNFPEISMFGMAPWGGYGANPAPRHFENLWSRIRDRAAGGAPYSEGIYEDLNKAIYAQFYWDPKRSAEETIREYMSFEFSPAFATELAQVARTFEENHDRAGIRETAVGAFARVERVEIGLSPQARASWRWRLIYLRALIDKELFERHGRLEGETLRSAFQELTRLYYAENAHSMPVRPPTVK